MNKRQRKKRPHGKGVWYRGRYFSKFFLRRYTHPYNFMKYALTETYSGEIYTYGPRAGELVYPELDLVRLEIKQPSLFMDAVKSDLDNRYNDPMGYFFPLDKWKVIGT